MNINKNNYSSSQLIKSIRYPFGSVEYFGTYYPTRYLSISNQDVTFRASVWSFKDGNPSVLTNDFYEFIKCFIERQIKAFPGKWAFLAAPASSAEKNETRYCKLVSWLKTKFNNLEFLYDYVNYTGWRTPSHKTNCRKTSGMNEIFTIDRSVKGMNIVIFDDIITSGHTMNDLAQKLKAAGANKICFCALGVTFYERAAVRA